MNRQVVYENLTDFMQQCQHYECLIQQSLVDRLQLTT